MTLFMWNFLEKTENIETERGSVVAQGWEWKQGSLQTDRRELLSRIVVMAAQLYVT